MKRVLVIAPHADDEVLGVGGTIQKYIEKKYEVNVIICCKRKVDNNIDHINCLNILKVKKIFHLNMKDEKLNEYKNELLKKLEDLYYEIKPNIIYIPNKNDLNQDHKTVYDVCEVVLRRYQPDSPEMIFSYETPSSTTQSFKNNFKINWYESISKKQLNKKIKAFYQYKNEIRKYPNPRNDKGIKIYAKFRGMECNSKYSEAFNLIYSKK
jgi:LmbE family N-acetylglucosaminyl deacetylase